MDDFEAARPLTKRVGKALLNPAANTPAAQPLGFAATLAAKQEGSLQLPAGPSAVRTISVKLGDYRDEIATRSTILKIEFDGKESVWCPVGDFFGTGVGLHPFQGWERTVAEDGTMTCRWVMPY